MILVVVMTSSRRAMKAAAGAVVHKSSSVNTAGVVNIAQDTVTAEGHYESAWS